MQVLHEAKGEARELDPTCIVPAFGARLCPKLVGEVQSKTQEIRVNALKVLCDELKNPISVVGCIRAGVVPILNAQTQADLDRGTRQRASKALELCARDPNGLTALIECNTALEVLRALDDQEDEVRCNLYEALIRLSASTQGVSALIEAGYACILVTKAANETAALQPLALKLLRNCLRDDKGLKSALEKSATETCISLLTSANVEVRQQAANTLTTLCFAEIAKITAIEENAVPTLLGLLTDDQQGVRAAAAGALMAVTTTDEGKRRMVSEGAESNIESVNTLVNLLRESNSLIKTNALKCIANIAVHPRARAQMKASESCMALLNQACESSDGLIAKHASIAKKAVLWNP